MSPEAFVEERDPPKIDIKEVTRKIYQTKSTLFDGKLTKKLIPTYSNVFLENNDATNQLSYRIVKFSENMEWKEGIYIICEYRSVAKSPIECHHNKKAFPCSIGINNRINIECIVQESMQEEEVKEEWEGNDGENKPTSISGFHLLCIYIFMLARNAVHRCLITLSSKQTFDLDHRFRNLIYAYSRTSGAKFEFNPNSKLGLKKRNFSIRQLKKSHLDEIYDESNSLIYEYNLGDEKLRSQTCAIKGIKYTEGCALLESKKPPVYQQNDSQHSKVARWRLRCFIFSRSLHVQCNFVIEVKYSKNFEVFIERDVGVFKAVYEEDCETKSLQPPGIRTHLLQDEQERIRSFYHYSHLPGLPVDPQTFAAAGFFLISDDVIRCYYCLREWQLHNAVIDPFSQDYHESLCHIIQRQVRPVCSDVPGRISDEIGDPPGQQSVYIPPGDVRNETYRLSTFEHFPVSCPTSRRGLAKSGFYYTGFFDRVKCFACGRSVERWEARDDPAELRWHKPACPFPKGEPCGNIPINDIFNRLSTNALTRQSQSRDEVIHQTDPNTGAIIRTVRYPADLPERIRRTGGTFHIGPGNALTIQSGPGPSGSGLPVRIGNQSLPNDPPEQRPFRLANVVSPDHRRFLSNLFLNRELDRLSSFGRWPVSRPTIPPAALARSGFFYLGDMDRTQCFSCSGVLRNWTIEDDAIDEHRNHFPNCKMVLRTEDRNVPIPEEDPSPENREQLFPCRYPSNPHMRNEAARLATFDQRWPRRTVGAAPAVIAQAGFFFLGERDRVKCWYCNGGLQNWEYDDLPWIEHAKWFPNCQFVLQKQGVRFVYRNLSLYPHLNRPIIARQEGATIDPAGTNTPRAGLAMSSRRGEDIAPVVRPPSPPPTIIDPQVEMRKKKERISNIIKNSEVVKTVTGMGFSEDTVRHVLEEKIDSGNVTDQNNIFDSATSLLDAVMEYENRMEEEEEEQPGPPADEELSHLSFHSMSLSGAIGGSLGPAPGSGLIPQVRSFAEDEEMMEDRDIYGSINESVSGQAVAQNSVAPVDKKSLQETLDKMEEERQCKVCFSNPADMVFVPCGHMICCMDCTQALRQCPVCRKKIEKAIKTYVK